MLKKIVISFMCCMGLMGNHARAQNQPKLVLLEVKTVYIPGGFDDNDRSQVVIEGILANSCYKVGPQKYKVNKTTHTIFLEQWAYQYSGMCLQMIIPFMEVFDLGIHPEANYDIVDAKSKTVLGSMPIRASNNSGPDDYLYAHVNDARVEGNQVVVEGIHTNSCLSVDEVRVLKDSKNVVAVLPIAKNVDNGNCEAGRYPFRATASLPELDAGRYLLHVRTLNGRAINKIFEVDAPVRVE